MRPSSPYWAALGLLCALTFTACGGESPSSPSPVPSAPAPAPSPAPIPAPAPAPASLTGFVTVSGTSVRLSNITVKFLDGPNAGQSTVTDGTGTYRFASIQAGNTNLSVSAPGWSEARAGSSIDGPTTLNFTMLTSSPYVRNGSGNDVWTIPVWVRRVRIQGTYRGNSSNFVIWCGTQLVVNELLGTGWGRTAYDGTHLLTASCTTEMRTEISTGVSWSVTEVR